MIRIREIRDPDLREKVRSQLATNRGCAAAQIPDWFELDDADFVDLINDLRDAENPAETDAPDYPPVRQHRS